MFARIKMWGILIYFSVSPFLCWGNCDVTVDIQEILSSKNIEHLKTLAQELELCPDEQELLGTVYHKLGVAYYSIQLDSSIYYTEKSLVIRKTLFSQRPTIDLGKTYHNLGTFYLSQKRYELAKLNFNQAILIFQNLNKKRLIKSYLGLGNTYVQTGEYAMAMDLFILVEKEAKIIDYHKFRGKALLNLGLLYLRKKNYIKSIEYLLEAQPLIEKYANHKDIASCYNNLAVGYLKTGGFTSAINYFKKANEIYLKIGDCENSAKCYNNLGFAFQKNHQSKQSLLALKKGLKIAESCNNNKIIAQSYDHFGEYYLAKSDFKNALKYFQKAILALTPSVSLIPDLEHPSLSLLSLSNEKIDLLIYISDKAAVLQSLYAVTKEIKYLYSAVKLFELGDGLIDQLRIEQSDEDSKLFWRKEAVPFYENAIQVCYDLKDKSKAFFFFEKSKAVLLLEAMQMSDALESLPQDIKNEMNQIRKEITSLKTKIQSSNKGEKEQLLAQLLIQNDKYFEKSKALAKEYPQYFDTKFNTEVINLDTYRKKYLLKNDLALHFFYGKQFIFLMAISKDKVQLIKVAATSLFNEQLKKYNSFFTDANQIDNHPDAFLDLSYNLFQLIFKDINLDGVTQLVIFPDGGLANLPFETLVQSKGKSIFDADYLLNDFDTYYSYSAKILSKIAQLEPKQYDKNIIAFAPFTKSDHQSEFATLNYSDSEISGINAYANSELIRDAMATKHNFIDHVGESAILHLSTHAFSNAIETQPYIAFSDSLLYLSEIYGMDMKADLVVLSACETNSGKLSLGEGVLSLGRGFTYAGAKSLISSLWKINAKSTGLVLADFYQNLANGSSKFKALSSAKRHYLANDNIPSYEKSPYYWGGLIYFGDTGVLPLEKLSNHLSLSILLIGVFIFAFAFWFYFKKR